MKMSLGLVLLFVTNFAFGQSVVSLQVTAADSAAATSRSGFRALGIRGTNPSVGNPALTLTPADGPSVPSIPSPGFYPADVTNPGGGRTIVDSEHHPIYVNDPSTEWGDPGKFLTDLGKSDFIHLLDQYVGVSSDDRYTLGTSLSVLGYPIPGNHTLQQSDLNAILHAAASKEGVGLEHIYHIFLPQDVDVCVPNPPGPQICYSPDNNNTFVFCALHGYVDFKSLGHVIYTLEPYQNVAGCNAPPAGTPNGQLTDSTDDTLSHEVFESISDPNLDAWWVQNLTFAYGNEIGDLCVRSEIVGSNIYSFYGNVALNGHTYRVQPEYSNQFHGCAYQLANQ